MFWYLKHVFSLLSRQWVQGWRRQTCALLAQIFTLRSPAQASDMQDMLQRETLHSDPTSSLLSSLHCASCLSLSLSPVSQKCPNVKFYNCYDWGLFWCKNDRKCQSLPHNSQPVSRTEDSRYAYRVVWGEVRADRGEVCPNKRLDRRQEHPQASHRAPPLCLHNTTGSTKMRQQLSDWDWD